MPAPYVSLAFARLPDPKLDSFASTIVFKMTGNPAFLAPTVSMAALGAAQEAFNNAVVAMLDGGRHATMVKNSARATLIALLRAEAGYVENNCNGSVGTLMSSGFDVRPMAGASSPLAAPHILTVKNTASTKLTVRATSPDNFKSIEVRLRVGNGAWQSGGVFTRPGRMLMINLVPGTLYEIQARAIGGSTGYSNWSDSTTHMAT